MNSSIHWAIQWATSPWGERIPVHIYWGLLWVFAIAAVLFLIVHALYVAVWAKPHTEQESDSGLAVAAAGVPEQVYRHSFGTRAFHWVMAACMLVPGGNCVSSQGGRSIFVGDDSLDRGHRTDDLGCLSRHSRLPVSGFLGHMA